jgi:CheY-like chemotaxis protein
MKTLHQEYPVKPHTPYILVVEDDLDDQILLKIAFEKAKESISLHFVCSANEALDFLQQTPDYELPLLIVAEYKLPGRNGSRLIQQLNTYERYEKIEKVILCDSCYYPIADKCFFKPHTFEGMMQLVEELQQLALINVI